MVGTRLPTREHELVLGPPVIGSPEADRQLCLHEIIQNWAARTPNATAVLYDGMALSYQELNRRANQLSRRLQRAGVGPGSLVGVSMSRSPEMVIALLAILKAGAAYVPLDPRLPRERLRFLVSDASLEVILTCGIKPEAGAAQTIDLWEEERNGLDDEEATDLCSGVANDDLVYVIYTSGSTGEPKGVMVPHRGVVNWLVWMRNTFTVTPNDVVLKKAPLTFDVSAWELFLPLISGARVVLANSDRQYDPAYLAELMSSTGVTIAQFVPSLLRLFLELKELPDLSTLRHVMCGGEALSPRLQSLFFERLTSELCNSYGPTEASIGVTRWPCRRDDHRSTVPIGYAIDNTELYILDPDLQPVAPGVPGELYISGICLGRGYLNRPELTAERFVPNPFDPDGTARMYRTGDLCRFLEDGSIDFIGRIDDQVKVRGVRIELGEVEQFISQHDSVEVAAAVVDDDDDDAVLVAFVVPASGKAVTERELRGFLRQKLPLSMIPSEFYFVQSLPISANGKLDRKALRLQRPRSQPTAAAQTPPDQLDQQLYAIWHRLLGRDDFGSDDDFFDSGGDSLLAVQLFARIEEKFGPRLSLNDVPDRLTIESLRRLVDGKQPSGKVDDAAPHLAAAIQPRRVGDVVCRLADIDDIEGIRHVCARAFVPYANASVEDFRDLCYHRWLNNPCRGKDDPFGWVLETNDGHIVGFHGLVPIRFWVGDQSVAAISPTTWAADPGYGRAALVLLSTYLDWGTDRFLLNTTANAITSAMHQNSNAGMCRIPIENFDERLLWVRDFKALLRWKLAQRSTHKLLRSAATSSAGQALIGAVAPFALGIVGGSRAAIQASVGRSRIRFDCRKLPIAVVEQFGPEFDELWERLKHHYAITTERTARILNWRHINPPRLLGRSYVLSCNDAGELLGYVALREPAITAPGHFIVTDLFYDPLRPEVMQNLLNAAFDFAAARSASVVEVFGFHPSLNRQLRTQNPYVLRRSQLERLGREPSLRNIVASLSASAQVAPSETYWYRAPNSELQETCRTAAWWPSGIDGDLNL